jgi:hypothetical protein
MSGAAFGFMGLYLCSCSALNTPAVLLCALQGEQLAAGGLASDGSTVVLASSDGRLAHFAADTVRCSGRTAGSMKVGLRLAASGCVQQRSL